MAKSNIRINTSLGTTEFTKGMKQVKADLTGMQSFATRLDQQVSRNWGSCWGCICRW